MYKRLLISASLAAMVLPMISGAQVVPLAASPTTTVNPLPLLCYDFKTTLRQGDTGDMVRRLQFFMTEEGINIPPSEYGTYGSATVAAVTTYQQKYASDILTPQQMTAGNGIFGKATRTKLNANYGCTALNKEVSVSNVTLKVNNIYLDTNGITATFCNQSPSDIPSFPVRLRVNGVIRDFDVLGAKKAGACDTETFGYSTWGLTYDAGQNFAVVTMLDPLSMYKTGSAAFPLTTSANFTVPVFSGPSLAVRALSVKTGGIQGTYCNVGTTDLTSFPVSIIVNNVSSTIDVSGAYKHATCSTITTPYSTWGLTYATGTVYSATAIADPNNSYKEIDTGNNAASVVGTP